MQNKILLSWVVQHLSKTAADANSRLCNDYISAAKKLSETDEVIADFTPLPPPLVITGMKMKFSANVSRGDKTLGGDLMLEFSKPANFHGEIELRPFDSKHHGVTHYDTGRGSYEQDDFTLHHDTSEADNPQTHEPFDSADLGTPPPGNSAIGDIV